MRTRAKRTARTYRVELAMLTVLIVLALGMDARSSIVLSHRNIDNILDSAAPLFLIAVGQLLVLLTAGIDLSVGSVFALTSMAATRAMDSHSITTGVLVGLGVGAAVGLVNGFLIVYLRLVPFVVTLATLSIASSLAYVVSNGQTEIVPDSFSGFDTGTLLPHIPNYVTVIVVTAIVAHLFLRRTVPGRFLYATGSSAEAARLAGVPTRAVTMLAYLCSGLLTAVAALLAMSELGAVDPAGGSSYLLNSIAAVVIGGASLFGGVGTVPGALIGVLIMALLQNVLVILQVPTFWQGTMSGTVIVLAILTERLVRGGGFASLRGLFGNGAGLSNEGGG